MTRSLIVLVALAAAAIAGVLGYLGASGRLSSARNTELEAIAVYTQFLERVRAERQQRPAIDASLRAVARP